VALADDIAEENTKDVFKAITELDSKVKENSRVLYREI